MFLPRESNPFSPFFYKYLFIFMFYCKMRKHKYYNLTTTPLRDLPCVYLTKKYYKSKRQAEFFLFYFFTTHWHIQLFSCLLKTEQSLLKPHKA